MNTVISKIIVCYKVNHDIFVVHPYQRKYFNDENIAI